MSRQTGGSDISGGAGAGAGASSLGLLGYICCPRCRTITPHQQIVARHNAGNFEDGRGRWHARHGLARAGSTRLCACWECSGSVSCRQDTSTAPTCGRDRRRGWCRRRRRGRFHDFRVLHSATAAAAQKKAAHADPPAAVPPASSAAGWDFAD